MSDRGYFLTLSLCIALSAGSARAGDDAAPPARPSDADSKTPSTIGKIGAVQEAMHQLYVVPRKRGTDSARTVAGQSARDGEATSGSAVAAPDGSTTRSNNSPTPEDIRRAFPENDFPATTRPAIDSQGVSYGPGPYPYPYYYETRNRLSSRRRDLSNYRNFDGQPGRYGYGRKDAGFGYDDYGYDGDLYRFGFNRGYDYGYFIDRSNERTEANLQHFVTHLSRGLELFRQSNYRDAADAFRLAADTHQGDPSARLYSAHSLFAIGRYADAVPYLRRAFELQPKIVFLSFDIRDDYTERSEFDQQLAALKEASQRAPSNLDRLSLLGYVLYFSDQRDAAYPVLLSARKLDRRDVFIKQLLENSRPADVDIEAAHNQK